MSNSKLLPMLAIAAALLGSAAALDAQTGAPAQPAKAAPASVKQLIGSFNAQRQAMIKQRQELVQKLKAAKTDAERKKILNDARKNDKALISAQHDLSKQVQNDIKQQQLLLQQQEVHHGPPGG